MPECESQCSTPCGDETDSPLVPASNETNQIIEFLKSAYEEKTKEVS